MDTIRWRVNADGLMEVSLSDYRKVQKHIRQIEPDINKELKKEFRRIAKPAQVEVKKAIPKQAPISGMRPVINGAPGRTTWGFQVPANKVTIDTKKPKTYKGKSTSIARLQVKSPATVIADMAGTVGKFDRRPRTREYIYTGPTKGKPAGFVGTRTHANKGQGRAMVYGKGGLKAALGRGVTRSKFVYPAFDKVAPQVRREAAIAVFQAVDKINAKMGS